MKVFTTGQVAKICKVAPRTVSKWFDSGRLKGYRIPGSQDRRIPREYLIKFLKEHGMPLGDLEDEAMAKVLLVGQDQVLIENVKRHLPVEKSFKIQVAASGFEAGIQSESFHPDCIVVDYSIGRIDAQQICQNLKRNPEYADTIVIALLPDAAMSPLLAREYNAQTASEYERIRDFLILHYKASIRADSELWRYTAAMPIPDSLQYKIDHFREHGMLVADERELFANPSWIAVYLGQGITPARAPDDTLRPEGIRT